MTSGQTLQEVLSREHSLEEDEEDPTLYKS